MFDGLKINTVNASNVVDALHKDSTRCMYNAMDQVSGLILARAARGERGVAKVEQKSTHGNRLTFACH